MGTHGYLRVLTYPQRFPNIGTRVGMGRGIAAGIYSLSSAPTPSHWHTPLHWHSPTPAQPVDMLIMAFVSPCIFWGEGFMSSSAPKKVKRFSYSTIFGLNIKPRCRASKPEPKPNRGQLSCLSPSEELNTINCGVLLHCQKERS